MRDKENLGLKSTLSQKISLVILGIFLSLILLELALRLGGAVFLGLEEHRNAVSLRAKGAYRILCLGESTTALGGDNSYPSQLEEILNSRNRRINFSVINKGIPGIDTSHIIEQLGNNLKEYKPDLVITMMGINDFGEYLSYKNQVFFNRLPSIASLRLFKLGRLLWLHVLAKNQKDPRDKIEERAGYSFARHDESRREAASSGSVEEALKKNIKLNPNNDQAYMDLGLFYLNQGRLVLELFKKAVELKTANEHAYIALGLWDTPGNHNTKSDISEVENVLKKAIEIDGRNDKAYFGLGLLYTNQADIPRAIASFSKALEINPANDRAYGALAALYDEKGDSAASDENFRKANELRRNYYNPQTVGNYLKLKSVLDKSRVRFVCVQYPLRSIKPLKNIFNGQEGVIYVDNERLFRKAIREHGYGRYFLDIFGGDFGHCSKEGNRLLAENIANAILKGVFGK